MANEDGEYRYIKSGNSFREINCTPIKQPASFHESIVTSVKAGLLA